MNEGQTINISLVQLPNKHIRIGIIFLVLRAEWANFLKEERSMTSKKEKMLIGLACLAVVFGVGIYLVNSNALSSFGLQPFAMVQSGVVQGAPPSQPAGTQGANYQPVLSSVIVNAVTGAPISGAYSNEFNITNLQGAMRKVTTATNTATNVDIGESYKDTVQLSGYYIADFSGVVSNPTTIVSLALKQQNTLSTWVNNDPANATRRNAITAEDTASAGGTLNPVLGIQGVTVNRVYGDGYIQVGADYNATQIKQLSFGQVKCPDGTVVTPEVVATPSSNALAGTVSTDTPAIATTNKSVKIACQLVSSQSILVPVNIELQAAYTNDANVTFKIKDYAKFVNTQTGAYDFGVENDAGTDSNSGTNYSQTYLLK